MFLICNLLRNTVNNFFDITNLKTSVKSSNIRRQLRQSNSESVVLPFLHGLQIKHRKFGAYIFITDTDKHRAELQARSFQVLSSDVVQHDSILGLGATVMHNKKYNLLFVLIAEATWELLDASIDIAERSTKQFEAQCHIVFCSTQILSSKHVQFKEVAK